MPTVEQIAAATGLSAILKKQEARRADQIKELASGRKHDSVEEALATRFESDELTIPVVQKNLELASSALNASQQTLSSVASTLEQALTTAADAISAPYSARKALAEHFDDLLDQTKTYVNNPGINGINLTGAHSKPLTVNTTVEGGKLTIANEAADANSLGVQNVLPSGWNSPADVQATINQIRNALNRITSIQSRYAAALAAISAAGGVNQAAVLAASSTAAALVGADVGAAVLEGKKSLAEVELATWGSHQIHRHHGHK